MRKNSRRVNRPRRSVGRRMFDLFLTGVSRLALAVGDAIMRNPVMTGGATAFLVVLSFVTANAVWYQPQAHNNVFFKTRPDQEFQHIELSKETSVRLTGGHGTSSAEPEPEISDIRHIILQSDAGVPSPARMTDATGNVLSDEMLAGLAAGGDKDVAILQSNLKQLGFYSGDVDGLTGPQTRKALEQWQNVQAKLAQNPSSPTALQQISAAEKSVSSMAAEANAVAVPEKRPARSQVDRSATTAALRVPDAGRVGSPSSIETPAMPKSVVSAEELVRIQAGLKAFGNDLVAVDGIPGKSTEEAIREFQKLFRLKVSGQADAELIGKMREIGLIS